MKDISFFQTQRNWLERDRDAQEIHYLESRFLPYILQQPEGKTDVHMGHMERIL